jgi:tetratricopeptide (TPR) repeat protein
MNADRDEQLGALFKRGYALVDKGRFAEAKPIFEACLWFGPHPQYDVAIRQELARVLRELGDLEGALALRLDAKSLQPDRHANLWKLADLLCEMGRYGEALKEAEAAMRFAPDHPHYQQTYAHIKRMLNASSASKPDLAPDLRLHTDSARGFEVGIPKGWEMPSGFLYHIANLFERSAISASCPSNQGFARMAIRVGKIGDRAKMRAKAEFPAEARLAVSGVPATHVEYNHGTTYFRKLAVINNGREYLLQFAHDGHSDLTIDAIIRSFRFL